LQKELQDFDGPVKIKPITGKPFHPIFVATAGARRVVIKQHPPNLPQPRHGIIGEFDALMRFAKVAPFAPKALLLCTDDAILGSPFFVMEYMDGQHVPYPTRENYAALIDVMADLHDIDLAKHGLADFGKPKGYKARAFKGWKDKLAAAKTQDMPDFAPVEAAIERLMPPEDDHVGAIHNGLVMENLLFRLDDKAQLRGVLDWRLTATGDSFMDLSNTLGHWIQENDAPSLRLLGTVPDGFSRAEAIARYEERRRTKVPHQAFYLTIGFYRRAVEMQQRYCEYSKGFTHDQVIVRLRESIKGLHEMALQSAG
jgi:aminoglycoside phosphotransferase (APT) family kinase protein